MKKYGLTFSISAFKHGRFRYLNIFPGKLARSIIVFFRSYNDGTRQLQYFFRRHDSENYYWSSTARNKVSRILSISATRRQREKGAFTSVVCSSVAMGAIVIILLRLGALKPPFSNVYLSWKKAPKYSRIINSSQN